MPPSSGRNHPYDPDIYFDDWQEENRRRQAKQTNYQSPGTSQARRPSANSRSSSSTAVSQLLSDAEYRNLQPHLKKYKAADAYLGQADSAKLLYEQIVCAAKAGCRDGTMTEHTANLYKVQMANAYEQYQNAMELFRLQVAEINEQSRFQVSTPSTRSSLSSQGRRPSNASIPSPGNRSQSQSALLVDRKRKHHSISRFFHR